MVGGQSFVGRSLAAFSPPGSGRARDGRRRGAGAARAAIGALSQRPPPQAIDAPVVTTRVIEAPPPARPEAVTPVAAPPATPRTPSRPARTPAAAPETRPVPALLALPLRGDGALAYAFVIDGQPGEAALNFHIGNGRYDITLERRSGDRELPVWHSEGRVGPQGLQPELHRVSRQGREREPADLRP